MLYYLSLLALHTFIFALFAMSLLLSIATAHNNNNNISNNNNIDKKYDHMIYWFVHLVRVIINNYKNKFVVIQCVTGMFRVAIKIRSEMLPTCGDIFFQA